MSRSIMLGIFSPFLGGECESRLVAELCSSAQARGVRVICIRTGGLNVFNLPIGLIHIDIAIVVTNSIARDYLAHLVTSGKPVVTIAHNFNDSRITSVESDNEGNTAHAVAEIIKAGHRNIAYVSYLTEYDISLRFAGYRRALAEHNLPIRPEFIVDTKDYGRAGGALAAKKILMQRLPITAVFAGTDRNASGVIACFQENGLRVPEDIAIIGYDNTFMSRTCIPPLASIDQNLDQIAERAVTIVLEQCLSNQRHGGTEIVSGRFIPRQSAGLTLSDMPDHQSAETPPGIDASAVYEIGKHLISGRADSVQPLMELLSHYIDWRCVAKWDDPQQEPNRVTIQEVFSYNDGLTDDRQIDCDIKEFPPLVALGKDTYFDSRHLICVLPIVHGSELLQLIAFSGLIGSVRHVAEVLECMDLFTPLFERYALDKNLASYQSGLEELVKRRTAEFMEAKERAEVASQAKSTFLANMSHELRSPLNSMLGFTRILLRDDKLSREEQKEALGIVLKSGEHLYTLINQILDLSKIESGHSVLIEKNVDLYELIDGLSEMFTLTAKDKGLRLIIDCKSHVPKYIRTDPLKLRQVLINLINNALKFTVRGNITLHIDTLSYPAAGQCLLTFATIDTGAGIAPEELTQLVKRLSRQRKVNKAMKALG